MISTYYEARGTMSRHSLLCLLALCLSRAGEAFTHNNGKQFARAPCSCRGAPPSFIASASTSTRQFNSLREVNDSNMKDLLFQPADGKVVLVDACASFCGPCKLIEPYLLEAAKKYSEQISVIEYDVENSNTKNLKVEMLLQGILVRGLPTLLLYKNGVPVATHSGAITETGLYEWLVNNLAKITGDINSVKVSKDEERDVAKDVPTGTKRGFVSFADRYSL